MRRILFEKTGNAVYISHLDLMRLFQRAFKRGGLNLKHTQGFSPRAMVSIALPLSVGVESVCEILDYELVGQDELSFEEIRDRLNRTMPSGVRVLEVYDSSRKPKELTHLDAAIRLEYDNGVPEGCFEAMKSFAKEIQKYVPSVMMTVVDTIPAEEIENCRKICEEEIGAVYRVREYIAD